MGNSCFHSSRVISSLTALNFEQPSIHFAHQVEAEAAVENKVVLMRLVEKGLQQ
jgi:hypothetical protein